MVMLHNLRPDLQLAYKKPVGSDRIGFATWFLGQAQIELQIAWGLTEPVLKSFCNYLNPKSGDPLSVSLPAGLHSQPCPTHMARERIRSAVPIACKSNLFVQKGVYRARHL
jgi:hypothetical protein